MIAALGTIGGAHINPAVTVAFRSVHGFPGCDVVIFGVGTDQRVPRGVPPFAIGAMVFAGALVAAQRFEQFGTTPSGTVLGVAGAVECIANGHA